jgi:hypothetical protein
MSRPHAWKPAHRPERREHKVSPNNIARFERGKGLCGTSISYCDRALPGELYVTIGFFDHPEAFRPEAHGYWGLRLRWVETADGLPHVDGYSRVRDAAIGNLRDRRKAPRP